MNSLESKKIHWASNPKVLKQVLHDLGQGKGDAEFSLCWDPVLEAQPHMFFSSVLWSQNSNLPLTTSRVEPLSAKSQCQPPPAPFLETSLQGRIPGLPGPSASWRWMACSLATAKSRGCHLQPCPGLGCLFRHLKSAT